MAGKEYAKEEEFTIICRCEDVILEEIHSFISRGITDMEQLKRLLRVGMGPCQGRTCSALLAGEIARTTGKYVGDIKFTTFRPLAAPIKLGILARGESHD
ncbi:(2Fe-2S)-binding protein [Thermanaerosceptrum fracticalcis]|uniref:(2Fe-2S)-binding protein n=1 Tax=Thermanaerosceptrum fracticalcis TaxID=1712410 RepID=A0A7G6DYZ0_THEFR|nr:(2Fe-2S)-binding protein [Thermanaerosceptrum fracticalcis]QNB45044.1 (2Fe-2S)-binding protein [Thermanaerosceptrum fracticalcis]